MRTEVIYCGYSYHDKPFRANEWMSKEHYLIRLQTEGECCIQRNSEEEQLVSGDLLILRPGEAYRLIVEEGAFGKAGSGDYYVICRGEWLDQWWAGGMKRDRTRIYVDEDLLDIWRLIILKRRRIGEDNGELIDYLLRSLCLTLTQAIRHSVEGNGRGRQAAAYQMKRYIEKHATELLSIEEVADHAQLSPSQATRLFKAAFGETPVRYALHVRLNIALERMEYSSLTLEQIAESCGFGSYPYFYRSFMKRFGASPRHYRYKASDSL